MAICPNCNGIGTLEPRDKYSSSRKCPSCRGTSQVAPEQARWERCRECRGYGIVGAFFPEDCTVCNSTGLVRPVESV